MSRLGNWLDRILQRIAPPVVVATPGAGADKDDLTERRRRSRVKGTIADAQLLSVRAKAEELTRDMADLSVEVGVLTTELDERRREGQAHRQGA